MTDEDDIAKKIDEALVDEKVERVRKISEALADGSLGLEEILGFEDSKSVDEETKH